uniref:Golden 2-like 2 transcription factor n=1 Tax=Solanum lycopersicum TaxID=4081 RepID=I6PA29_SOLLC|nr:golden 2-like 2 transcription factor [Solanum lycopersicum]
MLALSSSLSYKNERENYDLFQDFSHGNLIDTINFDDFFDEINGGDLLPDFEIFCEEPAIHGNMKSKSKEAKKII